MSFKKSFLFVVLILGILPWILYAVNINIGLSSLIDEGYFQLLMNTPEPIMIYGSQYNFITNSLILGNLSDFKEGLVLLWSRFWFQVASIFLFVVASATYLLRHKNKGISLLLYVGLSMLTGGVSLYLFTKVVSYNHVLQLTVLWITSCYLIYSTFQQNTLIRYCSLFAIGFCALFSILNILPSGLAVLGSVTLTVMLHQLPDVKSIVEDLFLIALGIIIGLLLFHLFVKDLTILMAEFREMYLSVSKLGRSYDSFSLLFNLSRTFLSLFVILIMSIGLMTAFNYLNNITQNRYLPYIVTLVSLGVLIIYTLKYTTKASLGLSEWILSPLLIVLMLYFRKHPLRWPISKKDGSVIFLATLPIVASLGTNLGVASKFYYFACIWLFLIFLLNKSIDRKYLYLSLLFFSAIILYAHIGAAINYLKNRKDNSEMSQRIPKLNGIYITPKQKVHFEALYDTLKHHGYTDGDTILAFQPDLMSVYVVNATAGRQVYFVPSDFLANDLKTIKRPSFIILNDYSYGQIAKVIKPWGFPEKYHKINIGTPETENYFDAHKPRMLFCLK